LTDKENQCPEIKPCLEQECPKCHVCADDASIDKLSSPGGDGQIHMGTGFGKALYELSKQEDVNKVLELGTWFGGGSTLCIAKGLKESGSQKILYTVEIFEPAWLYARKRLKDYPVHCLLGGSVPFTDYLKEEEIPQHEKGAHFQLYYHRDLNLAKVHVPLLEPLCKNHKFDAILIDGNEYSGWGEFLIVNSLCKPKYLALHDVGTLKTIKISQYLNDHKEDWSLINSGTDGAAWQLYKNLKY